MPIIGFTRLLDKLMDGTKTQTIRNPRKQPLKVGDKLIIYWKLRTKKCKKLGEAIITKIVRKKFYEIGPEDAIKDGCKNLDEFIRLFEQLHPHLTVDDEFDIITFEWTKKECVSCSDEQKCRHAFIDGKECSLRRVRNSGTCIT
jgi:hypothetical protein